MTQFVRVKGLKEFRKIMEALENQAPKTGRDICKNIATNITREAKNFAPIWKGELRDSIQTETKDENTFVVSMADYGTDVEEGHPISEITPLLVEWSADIVNEQGGNTSAILNSLLLHGARPSPFIMPAYQIVEADIPRIIENHISKLLNSTIRK